MEPRVFPFHSKFLPSFLIPLFVSFINSWPSLLQLIFNYFLIPFLASSINSHSLPSFFHIIFLPSSFLVSSHSIPSFFLKFVPSCSFQVYFFSIIPFPHSYEMLIQGDMNLFIFISKAFSFFFLKIVRPMVVLYGTCGFCLSNLFIRRH